MSSQQTYFEEGEIIGNTSEMTLNELDISRIEDTSSDGKLTMEDLTIDVSEIEITDLKVPAFVTPDMPDGIESGSVILAKDFYEYFAFGGQANMCELFSCRNKKMVKRLYIDSEAFWKTRNNQHLVRHVDQVLYALSRHYRLCKVVKNNKIQWNRLTWYTQTIGNSQSIKYMLDTQYIEMLIDHKDAQMEIQRLRKSRIN